MRTIKTYSKGRPFIMRFSGVIDSQELLTSDVGHDQSPWHHRPLWISSAMLGLGFFFAMVLFFLG